MLLTLILLAGCEQEEGLGDDPETFEESIDAFLAEQSLEPADCGTVDYRQACDADGEAAVACFADALATCSPARLDAVESTIEGDPIYSAFILWQNGANCQVERFSDWSEDEFAGDGDPIQEAACYDAELVEQEETCDAFGMECFSPCDDGSDCG